MTERIVLMAVLSLVLVPGCVPGSAVALHHGRGGEYTFEVAADYETVCYRIMSRARAQYQRDNPLDGGAGVDANLDPRERTAAVTVWSSYRTGHYHVIANIREVEGHRTQVRVSYALSTWKSAARQIERWAKTP